MTDNTTNNEASPAANWFIDEGRPGIGDRPVWLPDKFKTTADMAKAHAELEKRLGSAPDNYDFSKSKYLDPDYVPFQELQNFAKEKRVPKEVIDKMIESFDKYTDEFSTDYTEEFKKLGDNGRERIQILDNWAKANLSQEAYEGLTNSINNAASIKALEELRGKFMSTQPHIQGNNGTTQSAASLDDIKMELANNLGKYKTDENYRKDLQKRLEIAAKNAPGYIDKIGA